MDQDIRAARRPVGVTTEGVWSDVERRGQRFNSIEAGGLEG
jgi:hypothetical protein